MTVSLAQTELDNILKKRNLELVLTLNSDESTKTMKVKNANGDFQILKIVTINHPIKYLDFKPLELPNNNFVKYFNYFFEKPSFLCYLMEFCEGGSSYDQIESLGRHLNEREINAIALATLQSLSFLHSQNIVHRDLKAQNILLTNSGQLKLTDTSIMHSIFREKALHDEEFNPSFRSPHYNPKEPQIESNNDVPNSKYDIWCLGLILIQLFENKTVLQLNLFDSPSFPSKCSTLFRQFLYRCLNSDERHIASADELLNDPYIKQLNNDQAQEILKSLTRQYAMYLEEKESDVFEEDQISDIEEDVVIQNSNQS